MARPRKEQVETVESAVDQVAAADPKVPKAKKNSEILEQAARVIERMAGERAPYLGAIIAYTEPHSGKQVPAIVNELRLRPAPGWKPGETAVEAVCLVLSAHTSRTYTVTIPITLEGEK
jgi:hypothetical protein